MGLGVAIAGDSKASAKSIAQATLDASEIAMNFS
jgi:hypothetical protein